MNNDLSTALTSLVINNAMFTNTYKCSIHMFAFAFVNLGDT